MIRVPVVVALLALVFAAACDKSPSAPVGAAKELAADGTLTAPDGADREPAPTPDVTVPSAAAAAPAMSAAAQALRDAAKALYTPPTGYDDEVSDIVSGFPAYFPEDELAARPLRIIGSDSMGPMLTVIASRFEEVYPAIDVEVRQGGTARGLAALLAGECDLAAISDQPSEAQRAAIEKATGKRLFIAPIALDAVCVYVNRDNPIPSLTKAQCNGLVSITHSMTPQPILRWKELDPDSPFGGEFPPLYVLDRGSGTMHAFTEWCMPGERVTTILCYVEPTPGSVVNACCAYPLAIGVAGFGVRQPRARAVPLDGGSGPVDPTIATIRDRTYPIVRSMSLAFVAADEASIPPAILEWLQFCWSEDGQDAASQLGIVPPTLDMMPAFLGTPENDLWR